MRALRLLPAGVPDVRAARRRGGLAAGTAVPDARRGGGAGRTGFAGLLDAPGPVPRVPGVRDRVPVGGAVRSTPRTVPRGGREAGEDGRRGEAAGARLRHAVACAARVRRGAAPPRDSPPCPPRPGPSATSRVHDGDARGECAAADPGAARRGDGDGSDGDRHTDEPPGPRRTPRRVRAGRALRTGQQGDGTGPRVERVHDRLRPGPAVLRRAPRPRRGAGSGEGAREGDRRGVRAGGGGLRRRQRRGVRG